MILQMQNRWYQKWGTLNMGKFFVRTGILSLGYYWENAFGLGRNYKIFY
jgi:hypothetical protein